MAKKRKDPTGFYISFAAFQTLDMLTDEEIGAIIRAVGQEITEDVFPGSYPEPARVTERGQYVAYAFTLRQAKDGIKHYRAVADTYQNNAKKRWENPEQ